MWLKHAIKQKELVDFYSGTMYEDPEYRFAPGDPEEKPWDWSKSRDDFYASNMGLMLSMRKDLVRQTAMLIVKELAYVIGEYEEIKYDYQDFGVEDEEAQEELELFREAAEKSRSAIYSMHQDMMSPRGYQIAFDVFSTEGIWDTAFGGKPWAEICSRIVSLINAISAKDLQITLDQMIDIAHNTEKLIDSFQSGERFWAKPFLDEKSKKAEGVWRGLPEGRITRHKERGQPGAIYYDEDSLKGILENLFYYLDEIVSNIFRYCVSVYLSEGMTEDRFPMTFRVRLNKAFKEILPVATDYVRKNVEKLGYSWSSGDDLEWENRIRYMILGIRKRFDPRESSFDDGIVPYDFTSKMSFQGSSKQSQKVMSYFAERVRPILFHSLDKFFSDLASKFS